MPTRPRSNSHLSAAAIALAASCSGALVSAQPLGAVATERDESGVRARYGFDGWRAPGPVHTGVALGGFGVPGLTLRARTDRMPRDGGITLSYGLASRTSLLVRVAVAPDAATAREVLLGYLRSAQATLVPLDDRRGADVAFGDSASGHEAAAAVFGNVAVWIARTSDAGPETPSAVRALLALQIALAPVGTPTFATPSLLRSSPQGSGRSLHVQIAGGAFGYVEARVRGGHLHGAAGPSGMDIVPGGRGAVEVRVVATDALGRSGQGSLLMAPQGPLTRL